MMEVSLDYIGVGVNRVVNALAWSEHGGVAYAAHHMIALYDIKSAKVLSTICGHTGMVNCVHWVPREVTPELLPSQQLLLSGAADNTVCCWLVTYPQLAAAATTTSSSPSSPPKYAATPQPSWRRLAVLQGHTAPVTSVAVHRLPTSHIAARDCGSGAATAPEARLLLVSTAGDADVIVWSCSGEDDAAAGSSNSGSERQPAANCDAGDVNHHILRSPEGAADSAMSIEDGAKNGHASATGTDTPTPAAGAWYGQSRWRLSQRIHVGTKMQTTAAMAQLPLDPEWTLLATGGTDRKVHLYVRPPAGATGSVTGGGCFAPACVLEGHENWIRGVSFCCVEGPAAGPQLLLASVSQDRYGRIWKLQPEPLRGAAAAAAVSVEHENSLTALIQRYAPKPHVDTTKTRYVATCEALLIGHEDWVHGLQWAPTPPSPTPPSSSSPEARVGETAAAAAAAATVAAANGEGAAAAVQQRVHTRATAALLTASMDRTMIIWRFEADSGLWMNEASLGDAGASCLGYFGGVWGAGGSSILAHGFTGALHLWSQPPAAGPTGAASNGPWLPYHALGGHFGAVVDLGWGLDGGCLISVSEDQTARVHTGVVWNQRGLVQGGREGGEEQRENVGATTGAAAAGRPDGGQRQEEQQHEAKDAEGGVQQQPLRQLHWCEVARAQIHGHDFRCVAPVATPPGGPYVYVSGSEEKVLRVLEAPQAFIDTLVALRGGEDSPGGRAIRAEGRRGHGFGAAVAALGLSNKAVDMGESADGGANAGVGSGMPGGDYTDGPDFVPCAAPQVVREPPLEEHLAQNTLWPETHKLYGHGNDVFCTAASPDGRYLASACKAQTAATAAIWVWCSRTWRAVAQLKAHTLTVTQMEWSSSGSFLVAASRDRTFSVFRRRRDAVAAETPVEEVAPPGAAAATATAEASPSFELLCRVKSAHGRVIWSVSWSLDEQLIATASRDDTVKVWRMGGAVGGGGCGGDEGSRATAAPSLALTLPQFPCAATATAFAPRLPASPPVSSSSCNSVAVSGKYVLAVGLEDGSVQVWQLAAASGDSAAAQGPSGLVASCLWTAGDPWRHVAAVRRLRWRGAPGTATAVPEGDKNKTAVAAAVGVEGNGALQLASGSEDHSVRVFTLLGI